MSNSVEFEKLFSSHKIKLEYGKVSQTVTSCHFIGQHAHRIAYFLFVMTFVEELFTNMAIKSSIVTSTVISKAIKLLTVLKIFVWNCLCYETWPFESWMRMLTCTKTNSVDFVAKWCNKFTVIVIWNPQISSYRLHTFNIIIATTQGPWCEENSLLFLRIISTQCCPLNCFVSPS